ncbi:MAG TPA: prepilin peptidase [Pirellulales bacterium]|nr:prepilin peptidase [Pirellulales bacterium]
MDPIFPASTWPAPFWWFACGWLFVFGACVGSFLNVVIYRLPAGLSLLYPGSRCPTCLAPIHATDNVPIFGWLRLAGRCRSCRAKISPRYPAVEFAVAASFALLAALGPLSGGAYLPSPAADVVDVRWDEKVLWAAYGYHMTLVCGLLCAALIEYDGHRLPWRLNLPLVLVAIAVPLLWPEVRPVACHWPADLPAWLQPTNAALRDGLAGLAVALILACAAFPFPSTAFSKAGRGPERGFDGHCELAVLVWIGLYLGWQAASALAVLAVATQFAVGAVGRLRRSSRRPGWNGCLATWTLLWIVFWKQIVAWCPFVGEQAGGSTLFVSLGATAALGLAWKFEHGRLD